MKKLLLFVISCLILYCSFSETRPGFLSAEYKDQSLNKKQSLFSDSGIFTEKNKEAYFPFSGTLPGERIAFKAGLFSPIKNATAFSPEALMLQIKGIPLVAVFDLFVIMVLVLVVLLVLLGFFIIRQSLYGGKKQGSELRFEEMMDASPTGMIIFQDYNLKYANQALVKLTGFSREELLSMEIWELIHPHSLKELNTENWFLKRNGKGMRLEFQLKTKSNREVWVDFAAQLIDYQGKSAYLATALDITEKKKFEQQLIEAEERYSLIVLATNDGISDHNLERDEIYLSPQWKEMLGFKDSEVPNRLDAWLELIHPEDQEVIRNLLEKLRKGEVPNYDTDHRLRCKDGKYKWIHLRLTVIFDADSRPVRVLGTHTDITERKYAEEMLRESEYRYKSLFSKNSAVMLILNPDSGKIQDVNQAACNYYGYAPEELKGLNYKDINILTREEMIREEQLAKQEGRSFHLLRHRLKNGEIRDVEVYNSHIEIKGKMLVHTIIYDVTHRKKMESELKVAKEKAEEATRAKSTFISSVSHEIRTPLNAIIGLTDLLMQETELSPYLEENLKSIKFSSDHLLDILNDVLDFSKLEAGHLKLDKNEFNLEDLVKGSVKALEYKAREKQIDLNYKIHPDIPPVLEGDSSRLRQILLNLLSNAVKFTSEGSIDVFVKLTSKQDQECTLKFLVSDTGIGIPESKLESIFETFSQAETNTFRKYGGTGLGLTISKKLAELQGGDIGVKSIEGMGSTFWVEIPFRISKKEISTWEEETYPAAKNLQGMKILLAEDDEMNQYVMTQLLKRWKAQVVNASNGDKAIEILSVEDCDLVLMDIHMPELNGYEAAKIIRDTGSRVLNHQVPIIALTADVSDETKLQVEQSGMNDYISKPCNQDDLYKKIIKNKPSFKTAKPGIEESDLAGEMTPGRQQALKKQVMDALLEIFDEDLEASASMLRHFLKQAPVNLLQIKDHIKKHEASKASSLLHKIKPGFYYLGFPETATKVQNLQQSLKNMVSFKEIDPLFASLEKDIKTIITVVKNVLEEIDARGDE